MKPILTIMCGISASGKSTRAKELAVEHDAVIVSSDGIRGELGDVQDQSNNTEVFKIFHHRIKAGLMNGYNVIADATNITIKSRRSIIESVKNIDCNIVGIVIDKPIDRCIEDNINRPHPVPEYVIRRQFNNFQMPTLNEGFDIIKLRRIR